MTQQQLINLQADGFAKTLQQANQGVHAAKANIPQEYKSLFRSTIRFIHDGYEWFVILK